MKVWVSWNDVLELLELLACQTQDCSMDGCGIAQFPLGHPAELISVLFDDTGLSDYLEQNGRIPPPLGEILGQLDEELSNFDLIGPIPTVLSRSGWSRIVKLAGEAAKVIREQGYQNHHTEDDQPF